MNCKEIEVVKTEQVEKRQLEERAAKFFIDSLITDPTILFISPPLVDSTLIEYGLFDDPQIFSEGIVCTLSRPNLNLGDLEDLESESEITELRALWTSYESQLEKGFSQFKIELPPEIKLMNWRNYRERVGKTNFFLIVRKSIETSKNHVVELNLICNRNIDEVYAVYIIFEDKRVIEWQLELKYENAPITLCE